MQIHRAMRYHFTPTRMANFKSRKWVLEQTWRNRSLWACKMVQLRRQLAARFAWPSTPTPGCPPKTENLFKQKSAYRNIHSNCSNWKVEVAQVSTRLNTVHMQGDVSSQREMERSCTLQLRWTAKHLQFAEWKTPDGRGCGVDEMSEIDKSIQKTKVWSETVRDSGIWMLDE